MGNRIKLLLPCNSVRSFLFTVFANAKLFHGHLAFLLSERKRGIIFITSTINKKTQAIRTLSESVFPRGMAIFASILLCSGFLFILMDTRYKNIDVCAKYWICYTLRPRLTLTSDTKRLYTIPRIFKHCLGAIHV